MRLASEKELYEVKPWRVVTKDGRQRGPVGVVQLQALLDVGLLTSDATIASIGLEDWQVIGEHSVWGQLRIAVPNWSFAGEDPNSAAGPQPNPWVEPNASTPAMRSRREAAGLRENQKIRRRLRLWYLAQAVRALREGVIFLAFLTLGDLLTSYFGPSLGIVKWMVAMAFLAISVGYYTLRALGK